MGLKEQLEGILPPDLLPLISDHFEVIGDVAVLTLPAELDPWKQTIALAIVSRRKNIATVLNRKGKTAGSSRTAAYETLLGERTVTVHREYGFSYRVDIRTAFFSARMASERKRVADRVAPGERVYVPFAGVGPFVIPAASRGAEVFAVEKNPDAFRLLEENVALNNVKKNCHIIQGDALETTELPHVAFDRLIIPAPYGMDHALARLFPLLSKGGRAHFYTFKTKREIPRLLADYGNRGLGVAYYAACGNAAPGVSRWVFDLVQSAAPKSLRTAENQRDSMISEEH